MRRLSRWILAVVSALAVWRWWSRRRRQAQEPAPVATDPADELRRKLDETRATGGADPVPADEAAAGESLEERRARVHAKAQEAMDEMSEEQP